MHHLWKSFPSVSDLRSHDFQPHTRFPSSICPHPHFPSFPFPHPYSEKPHACSRYFRSVPQTHLLFDRDSKISSHLVSLCLLVFDACICFTYLATRNRRHFVRAARHMHVRTAVKYIHISCTQYITPNTERRSNHQLPRDFLSLCYTNQLVFNSKSIQNQSVPRRAQKQKPHPLHVKNIKYIQRLAT